MKIGTADLAILVAYMVAMVLFGLWMGRGQRDGNDYMAGGRDLPWWAVMFSIVATETSTVTFLSIPGVAFSDGGNMTWLQLPMGYVLGRLLVVTMLLPRYFRGQLFTAYQVLQERFGEKTRRSASLLFMVTRTLADGLRLFLTAIVLQKVAGVNLETAVIGVGLATVVYTFAGGMRAVVWTDVVQFIVYMLGAVVAFLVLIDLLPGGWSDFWRVAEEHDKLRVFDFTLTLQSSLVFWAGLIGGAVVTIGSHGADQLMVQRYLCSRSQRDAARALALTGPVVLLQFAFFLLVGVGLFVFYTEFPPTEVIDKKEVFAAFIVDQLPVGVRGVVLGAVFSAAMSTLSSSLNSSATAAVTDFYLPWRRRAADHPSALRAARSFTIVFGALQIAVGIAGQGLDQSVVDSVMSIASFTTGIILGVFFLALFARGVDDRDAVTGLLCGIVAMSTVVFLLPRLGNLVGDPAYNVAIAWPWWSLMGSLLTYLFAVLSHRLRGAPA